MQEIESSSMELKVFGNVSQIHLFMLFHSSEYLLWSSNLAVYIVHHLYASTVKSCKPLVPLLFHCVPLFYFTSLHGLSYSAIYQPWLLLDPPFPSEVLCSIVTDCSTKCGKNLE